MLLGYFAWLKKDEQLKNRMMQIVSVPIPKKPLSMQTYNIVRKPLCCHKTHLTIKMVSC